MFWAINFELKVNDSNYKMKAKPIYDKILTSILTRSILKANLIEFDTSKLKEFKENYANVKTSKYIL